ncbi:hypothetical protein GRAN_3137 [Granulicella sibirica]|uniref:Uncharacterized protein n=1 Tax=Granulicella sibirica TaxID=2479048 RepID=A0A4Q0T1N1_9BACT|nr:hypothetical protein GRAN_3137 [Granulicella sibirica]
MEIANSRSIGDAFSLDQLSWATKVALQNTVLGITWYFLQKS